MDSIDAFLAALRHSVIYEIEWFLFVQKNKCERTDRKGPFTLHLV